MLESGLSGSVRGVPSNGHPYRDPRPTADVTASESALRFQAISCGVTVFFIATLRDELRFGFSKRDASCLCLSLQYPTQPLAFDHPWQTEFTRMPALLSSTDTDFENPTTAHFEPLSIYQGLQVKFKARTSYHNC